MIKLIEPLFQFIKHLNIQKVLIVIWNFMCQLNMTSKKRNGRLDQGTVIIRLEYNSWRYQALVTKARCKPERLILDRITKSWSGGTLIPNKAWAESREYKLKFPILDDRIMFLHNDNFWLTSVQYGLGNNKWLNTGNKFQKEKV